MSLARILATAAAAAVFAVSTSAAAGVIAAAPVIASPDGSGATASMSLSSGVLVQGSTATVTYYNPSLAGQWVCIQIDNGSRRNPQTATIEILLDSCGKGCGTWTVACWDVANFNAPGTGQVSCEITRG